MARHAGWLILAALSGALWATPSLACGVGSKCRCHGESSAKSEPKTQKDAPAPKDVKAEQKPHANLLAPIDELIAEKCGCRGAADCTCKKGSCKCSRCGTREHDILEKLSGEKDVLTVPENARNDATAGVFI